jgi:hypothetical protein
MKKILFLLPILALGLLGSCTIEGRKPPVNRKSENLYLRQLVKSTNQKTESSGSFFLVAGSYSSNSETKTVVQVFAKIKDEYRFMEIPIEKIRIQIDSSCKNPYVVLNYREAEEMSSNDLLIHPGWYINTYTIVCSEEYLPERLLPINL